MDIRTRIPTNRGEMVDKYATLWTKQISEIRGSFGEWIEEILEPGKDFVDVPVVRVKLPHIIPFLEKMKTTFEYSFLTDLTATDEVPRNPRFDVVYQLMNSSNFSRIRVKVGVDEGVSVPTSVGLWLAADWLEREVFDMFGVKFEGHPDLRRILMDERWEGYPLRKDYPLQGYQIFPEAQEIRPELLE